MQASPLGTGGDTIAIAGRKTLPGDRHADAAHATNVAYLTPSSGFDALVPTPASAAGMWTANSKCSIDGNPGKLSITEGLVFVAMLSNQVSEVTECKMHHEKVPACE